MIYKLAILIVLVYNIYVETRPKEVHFYIGDVIEIEEVRYEDTEEYKKWYVEESTETEK